MITTDTISTTESRLGVKPNAAHFEEQVRNHCKTSLEKFESITRYYALFHILFFSAFTVELLSFLLFFSFFAKSSLLAFSLAIIFLTVFSYFVLLFYFQAKKPEQFIHLREEYYGACKQALSFERGVSETHLSLSHSLRRFASELHQQEANYYSFLNRFTTLSLLLKKFSIWLHWKDVHKMKELLLFLAINEHIQWVKSEPTDLEAHASLADTYCALSKLYMPPNKAEMVWVPPDYFSEETQQKFTSAAERAIEEFKILDDYAPNDQWVHAQLASLYHDIGLPEQEILEFEKMLKIAPQDRQILFRLGVLYFQQGYNAKGLRVYEQLKKSKDKKADELISYYDAYVISEA
ncbi:MAG TPA: hypothetical protein VLG49_01075 [Rhabdochlamydiaceae bacterium]|nr:hypothetical protein [Rhabdochlamydiaceae bacterium]